MGAITSALRPVAVLTEVVRGPGARAPGMAAAAGMPAAVLHRFPVTLVDVAGTRSAPAVAALDNSAYRIKAD